MFGTRSAGCRDLTLALSTHDDSRASPPGGQAVAMRGPAQPILALLRSSSETQHSICFYGQPGQIRRRNEFCWTAFQVLL